MTMDTILAARYNDEYCLVTKETEEFVDLQPIGIHWRNARWHERPTWTVHKGKLDPEGIVWNKSKISCNRLQ